MRALVLAARAPGSQKKVRKAALPWSDRSPPDADPMRVDANAITQPVTTILGSSKN